MSARIWVEVPLTEKEWYRRQEFFRKYSRLCSEYSLHLEPSDDESMNLEIVQEGRTGWEGRVLAGSAWEYSDVAATGFEKKHAERWEAARHGERVQRGFAPRRPAKLVRAWSHAEQVRRGFAEARLDQLAGTGLIGKIISHLGGGPSAASEIGQGLEPMLTEEEIHPILEDLITVGTLRRYGKSEVELAAVDSGESLVERQALGDPDL